MATLDIFEKIAPGHAVHLLNRVLYQEHVAPSDEAKFNKALSDPRFLTNLASEMLPEEIVGLLKHAGRTIEIFEESMKDRLTEKLEQAKAEGKPVVLRTEQEVHDYAMTFTDLLDSYQDPDVVKAENISKVEQIRASFMALGYLPFPNPQLVNQFTTSDRTPDSLRNLRAVLRSHSQPSIVIDRVHNGQPLIIKATIPPPTAIPTGVR